jgi:hypothetical protein
MGKDGMSRPNDPRREILRENLGVSLRVSEHLSARLLDQLELCVDDAARRLLLPKEKRKREKRLKILEFTAENFKRLRVVRIIPDGHLVQLTGPNAAGKTSAVDAVWFLLKGIKGLPSKPVRVGAENMRVIGRIGDKDMEFVVTRSLAATGKLPSLDIRMIKGKRDTSPQDFLDGIFDMLTFDPLEFIRMDAKAQVAKLRETAKVDLDFETLAAANEADYKERHQTGLEAKALEVQIETLVTLDGLPKEKLDEAAILGKLEAAGESNRKAQEMFRAKQTLEIKARSAREAIEVNEKFIDDQAQKIADLEEKLKAAKLVLTAAKNTRRSLALSAGEAQVAYEAAPAGDPIDVMALTTELQSAQRTNRAIDAWRRKEELKGKLETKKLKYDELTAAMSARDEKKRVAISKAKIPVEGLAFNESMTEVTFNGLPLENLGEGEQIRLSARIGMAANPKLRVLCIRHGEALDEAGIKILGDLATEHDFQLWIARVDTSGKVGIVLEEGVITARNEAQA